MKKLLVGIFGLLFALSTTVFADGPVETVVETSGDVAVNTTGHAAAGLGHVLNAGANLLDGTVRGVHHASGETLNAAGSLVTGSVNVAGGLVAGTAEMCGTAVKPSTDWLGTAFRTDITPIGKLNGRTVYMLKVEKLLGPNMTMLVMNDDNGQLVTLSKASASGPFGSLAEAVGRWGAAKARDADTTNVNVVGVSGSSSESESDSSQLQIQTQEQNQENNNDGPPFGNGNND